MAVDELTSEGLAVDHGLTPIAAGLDHSPPMPCVPMGRRGRAPPPPRVPARESGRPRAIASPRNYAAPRPVVISHPAVVPERLGTQWTLPLAEVLVASGALALIAVLLGIGADLRRRFDPAPLIEEALPAAVRLPQASGVGPMFGDPQPALLGRATAARAAEVTSALRHLGIDGVTAFPGENAEIVLRGTVDSAHEKSLSLTVARALSQGERLVDRIVAEPE
jgi:hypothetical protein